MVFSIGLIVFNGPKLLQSYFMPVTYILDLYFCLFYFCLITYFFMYVKPRWANDINFFLI